MFQSQDAQSTVRENRMSRQVWIASSASLCRLQFDGDSKRRIQPLIRRVEMVTRLLFRCFLFGYLLICHAIAVDAQEAPLSDRAEKVYRPTHHQIARDDTKAKRLGISKYESKHLILYTDIAPEIAETLPAIVDQAYLAWTEYFGELPPARDGKPFQITGYLMADEAKFIACGMQPEGFVMAKFGRQIGLEFWMHEQDTDYYRRHLLIHEATHAFMTTMPSVLPPLWYHEGMAEYFATHTIDERGVVEFCVFPESAEEFKGLGRIDLLEEELAFNRRPTFHDVALYRSQDFLNLRPVPYAWSWALCSFLDRHPRFQTRFRKLGRNLEAKNFLQVLNDEFANDEEKLAFEWSEFTQRIDYGYDFDLNEIEFADSLSSFGSSPVQLTVEANQGWKSSGFQVAAGSQLKLQSSGQVTLASTPKTLLSSPQGISFDYANGYPIGALLIGLKEIPDPSVTVDSVHFIVLPIGREFSIPISTPSEIFFRVNDLSNSIADNQGEFKIEMSLPPTGVNP